MNTPLVWTNMSMDKDRRRGIPWHRGTLTPPHRKSKVTSKNSLASGPLRSLDFDHFSICLTRNMSKSSNILCKFRDCENLHKIWKFYIFWKILPEKCESEKTIFFRRKHLKPLASRITHAATPLTSRLYGRTYFPKALSTYGSRGGRQMIQ